MSEDNGIIVLKPCCFEFDERKQKQHFYLVGKRLILKEEYQRQLTEESTKTNQHLSYLNMSSSDPYRARNITTKRERMKMKPLIMLKNHNDYLSDSSEGDEVEEDNDYGKRVCTTGNYYEGRDNIREEEYDYDYDYDDDDGNNEDDEDTKVKEKEMFKGRLKKTTAQKKKKKSKANSQSKSKSKSKSKEKSMFISKSRNLPKKDLSKVFNAEQTDMLTASKVQALPNSNQITINKDNDGNNNNGNLYTNSNNNNNNNVNPPIPTSLPTQQNHIEHPPPNPIPPKPKENQCHCECIIF